MSQPQILIHQMSFHLPSGKTLFDNLNLTFSQHKTGLVGKNGIGKSTLLKLILGKLQPSAGAIHVDGKLAYVPQDLSFVPETTIADLFGCAEKIAALQRITQGSIDAQDFTILNEEWDIEERLQKQLNAFGLNSIPYHRQLKMLSGGELTRLILAKAFFTAADFLILDEPTNHLDQTAREQLYTAIQQWPGGLIAVSHDRALLNCMEKIFELTTLGTTSYGGNYDDYVTQKNIEHAAKEQQLQDAKKLMRKTKTTIQSSYEKHEQKQSYGRKLRQSGSIDKLAANAKKGRSERTQSKLLIKEQRLMEQATTQLKTAKEKIEINEQIHVALPATQVPNGKIILAIEDINFSYPEAQNPIIHNFTLKIQGPERIALIGDNGSGKTTLIKLIQKEVEPQSGQIYLGTEYVSYLDQNTTLLKPESSILENFLRINPDVLEKDAYFYLARFLFRNVAALKLIKNLSGGEKLRALLACILSSKHPPQLLILDEPTNNLDLNSIESVESALKNYQGAMIVVSHDQAFLKNIDIVKVVNAPFVDFGFDIRHA